VTGATSNSNVTGVNDTPSTKGSRNVGSAFAELAVPLVSPEMNIPLVRRIDLQLAGRYEHYSDFGSVAKPKIAFAWDVVDGVRFRGSWQKGFRAPNLETTNPFAMRGPIRSPTITVARPTFAPAASRPSAPVRAAWASASRPPAIRT
jgi:iron complex outermembrane receptor protein